MPTFASKGVARSALAAALASACSGCATSVVWELAARGELGADRQVIAPWSYVAAAAATPVTLAFDVIAFPVQLAEGVPPYGHHRVKGADHWTAPFSMLLETGFRALDYAY
jgi:hypothetical protein